MDIYLLAVKMPWERTIMPDVNPWMVAAALTLFIILYYYWPKFGIGATGGRM